ncbi:MAG: FAD-dependent oxidoreductase [Rhodovulum sulfidophilum]|uniref:FAD-dependent oxidoreductase n=1 Tax=Rhodovulum sulfidophilum TaxID=35806 RepID=A0A2W5NGJ9_RHOSU|nr:MAG: FAD-dependent oxidoreductase [Rhodovulum sulfidophilum]
MERPPPREAEVTWRDGDVPVSARYGEGYYGDEDALAEKRHVFIEGNGLPARFAERATFPSRRSIARPFQIAETGFGTGLNALAAAIAWRRAGCAGTLRYTAFEAHPVTAPDMARALAPWPELAPLAAAMVAAWDRGERVFSLSDPAAGAGAGGAIEIEVIEGDARETVPGWRGRADAWFLDGFSPARNPELWEPALISAIAERCFPAATLSTYTAAAKVRAALEAAGLRVERRPGFGRKKHMTRAWDRRPRLARDTRCQSFAPDPNPDQPM